MPEPTGGEPNPVGGRCEEDEWMEGGDKSKAKPISVWYPYRCACGRLTGNSDKICGTCKARAEKMTRKD